MTPDNKEPPFEEPTRIGGSSLTVLPEEDDTQTAEWEKKIPEIARGVFLVHSVPSKMQEAFAVFILRLKPLIKSLLSKEYQRGKRDELKAHRISEAEAFEAGMRIAYETIVGVIQEELKKLTQ